MKQEARILGKYETGVAKQKWEKHLDCSINKRYHYAGF